VFVREKNPDTIQTIFEGGDMKRFVLWSVAGLAFAGIIAVGFFTTNPKLGTENASSEANYIFYDAKWYEVLWMRWTAVDWVLTLLAAGTAVTAAVKNAFSAHSQAQDKAAGGDGAPSANSPKIDRVVMWFAALTIVATTLDAKIHPAQLAERYRQGDLLLQDSIMDYRHSPKLPADDEALLVSWHQAQKILEGVPAVPSKKDQSGMADAPASESNTEEHNPPPVRSSDKPPLLATPK
jgi:hypothetical protein